MQLTLRIDQDVVEWFRKHKARLSNEINALLRAYGGSQIKSGA
ncbi:MAG: BrnA antitoxin family protein [Acidobacteria bacterium]|nr:BrnA antitoxin family protein [Acidobacteriota bacterium]